MLLDTCQIAILPLCPCRLKKVRQNFWWGLNMQATKAETIWISKSNQRWPLSEEPHHIRAKPAPAAPMGPAAARAETWGMFGVLWESRFKKNCYIATAEREEREMWENRPGGTKVSAGRAPGTQQQLPAAKERPTEERAFPPPPTGRVWRECVCVGGWQVLVVCF